MDAGRYRNMEAFLKKAGLISEIKPVEDLAIDVTRE
jgi:hypothetical protein